jgi:hypothetical protein
MKACMQMIGITQPYHGTEEEYEFIHETELSVGGEKAIFTPKTGLKASGHHTRHAAKVLAFATCPGEVELPSREHNRDVGDLTPSATCSLVRYASFDWSIVDRHQDRDCCLLTVAPRLSAARGDCSSNLTFRRRGDFAYRVDSAKPGDWLVSAARQRQIYDWEKDDAFVNKYIDDACAITADPRLRRDADSSPTTTATETAAVLRDHGEVITLGGLCAGRVKRVSRTLAKELRMMLISLDSASSPSLAFTYFERSAVDRAILYDAAYPGTACIVSVGPLMRGEVFDRECVALGWRTN